MPCRDGGPPLGESHSELQQAKIDKLTRMLCTLCKRLEDHEEGNHIYDSHELDVWWAEHKEQDRIREQRESQERAEERFKKEAVAKLSPEERKVLGLEKYSE